MKTQIRLRPLWLLLIANLLYTPTIYGAFTCEKVFSLSDAINLSQRSTPLDGLLMSQQVDLPWVNRSIEGKSEYVEPGKLRVVKENIPVNGAQKAPILVTNTFQGLVIVIHNKETGVSLMKNLSLAKEGRRKTTEELLTEIQILRKELIKSENRNTSIIDSEVTLVWGQHTRPFHKESVETIANYIVDLQVQNLLRVDSTNPSPQARPSLFSKGLMVYVDPVTGRVFKQDDFNGQPGPLWSDLN